MDRIFSEEVFYASEHVFGVSEVLVEGDLLDELFDEGGLVGEELAVEMRQLHRFGGLKGLGVLWFFLRFGFVF